MKKITLLLFTLFCFSFGFAQTFTDSGGPYDTQNGNGTTAATCGTADVLNLPLTVTGVGTLGGINSIESVTLNITHTWNNDVKVSLQDPNGTLTQLLVENIGGSGDNFVNCVLIDSGTPLPTANTSPVTGSFAPLNPLNAFNSASTPADGNWILVVCDDTGGDIGTVDSWSITFIPTPTATLDYYNLQWPANGTIFTGGTFDVFAQAYEEGLTDVTAGQAPGIESWIGYSATDTDPSGAGWTWVAANFNVETNNGNNDEYTLNLGSVINSAGTFYYASRWSLEGGPFTYGGILADGTNGGTWGEGGNISGILTVNPPVGSVCEDPIVISTLPYTTSDNTSIYGDDYDNGDSPCNEYYMSGDDVVYSFTPVSDGSFNVSLTDITATWSGIHILDACPGSSPNCVGFQGNSGTADRVLDVSLLGGTTYFIIISTYATPQSTGYTLNITENSCTDATVEYSVVNDCDNSGGFNVEVEITDMGSASDITISDDQGSTPQSITSTGTYQFGPFVNGTDVVITVTDVNDSNCTQTSSVLTQEVCPPTNDDCSNATMLTVGSDLTCASPVAGTTIGATQSLAGCSGTANDDVWYSFVATGSSHSIIVNNTGGNADIVTQVFDSCGGTSLICQDTPNSPVNLTGLTSNNTYYFRIFTYSSTSTIRTSFTVCVGTPPAPPVNDECAGALPLIESTDSSCANAVSGTTVSAGPSASGTCSTTGKDVWYTFTPLQSASYIFNVTETAEFGSTSTYLSVYSGSCGTLTQVGTACSSSTVTLDVTAATEYYVVVRSTSSTNSVNFDLCAYPAPPPPANDACSGANIITALPYDFSQTDGAAATNNAGFITACANTMNDGLWFTFTPTTDGTVDIVISNVATGFDPQLDLYSGSCGSFTCLASADSGFSGGGETLTAQAVTAGTQYFINVGNWSGTTNNPEGSFDINVSGTVTLGVESIENINGFTYFPNPVKNTLNLKAQSAIQNVSIYNMLGQEILRTSPNSLNSEVNMASLQTGAYFVKVTINDTTETIRVIKQ